MENTSKVTYSAVFEGRNNPLHTQRVNGLIKAEAILSSDEIIRESLVKKHPELLHGYTLKEFELVCTRKG